MSDREQLIDWPTIEAILRGSRLSMLYGPPGTGKTTAGINAARDMKLSVYNVTLTEETPAAELRGHFLPVGTEWKWMDGPALSAYRNGGLLILNEIDHAGGDALDFIHNLTDDSTASRMTLPSGETVFPNDDFRCLLTMNGEPQDLQSPAIIDRFKCHVYVSVPHPDAIASLPDDLQLAARNSAGTDNDPDRAASLRAWKVYAQLRESVGEDTALLAVFAHRATEIKDALALAGAR